MPSYHSSIVSAPNGRIDNVSLLVSDSLEYDESAEVAAAFSVGSEFNVDVLLQRAGALQYLSKAGAVLVFPYIVEAVVRRPELAAELVSGYLFLFGFYRPSAFLYQYSQEFMPGHLHIRQRSREWRFALVDSIPLNCRKELGQFLARIVELLQSCDEDELRSFHKFMRWIAKLVGRPSRGEV